jgi:hypothetical protein
MEQFKFAPPRTRVTAVRLAVALYSPVHSNGVRNPNAEKAVKLGKLGKLGSRLGRKKWIKNKEK